MKKIRNLFIYLLASLLLIIFSMGGFLIFKKNKNQKPELLDIPSKKITVILNGYFFEAKTEAKRVVDFLEKQKIMIGEEDYVFPEENSFLYPGVRIIIKNKTPLTIKVDGKEITHETFFSFVKEVLEEKEIHLSPIDKLNYGKEENIFKEMVIEIIRVNKEEITEEEKIAFKTVEKEDPKLKWGRTEIRESGEQGIREIRYELVYENGILKEKTKLGVKTIKEPVAKIMAKGTKVEIGEIYKGRASWYSFDGKMSCASLKHPLGTWLRVTNKTNGRSVIVKVSDRGPFSKDKIIDLDKAAFAKIGELSQGVVEVKVEEIID